mmetsp:Transcript_13151/g.28859  ORF Transcript_13151/g.28859 Transcript_13151/m.28859 type:complete len:229 (-) Transcript_13151:1112-1798(-)
MHDDNTYLINNDDIKPGSTTGLKSFFPRRCLYNRAVRGNSFFNSTLQHVPVQFNIINDQETKRLLQHTLSKCIGRVTCRLLVVAWGITKLERNLNNASRACANRRITLKFDLPTCQINKMLRNGKPQPSARTSATLNKTRKYFLLLILGDTRTSICALKFHHGSLPFNRNPHKPRERVFDCICHNIRQDLLDSMGVPQHPVSTFRHTFAFKTHPSFHRGQKHFVDASH